MKNKICTGCGGKYPAIVKYFYQDKRATDGLYSCCKKCSNKATGIYGKTEKGKAIIKKSKKKYYQTVKGKCAKRKDDKKYYSTLNGFLRHRFNDMNQRCNNSKCSGYEYYGGRGIKNKFKSADEFINYVINKLQIDPRGLQIDRIDNNGNYEPGNIRFTTHSENCKNRRPKL